ncbi:MAG: PLP-dependent aminotransferase family protein [Muribaculaceae bacterium]|nr:PLP-dependent aminotransferase family protein [Muribaculaceae bacterium]
MTRFAKSVEALRASQIRDLMSLATRPGIISFAGGMPGNDLFPLKYIDKITAELTEREKQVAMQYGPTTGLPQLLESLSEFLKKKGLPVESHKLIITTGSLQAINILAKAFVDINDDIIVENPSFIGALSAFKSYEANINSCGLDDEGIIIDDLKNMIESLEAQNRKPKFVYITPTFHNPAGVLYTYRRRKQLVELLAGHDIPLIEDDAYGDLTFESTDSADLTPIVSMAGNSLEVCYTGSFSKIIGPGLRLGWMLVPPTIYRKCELIKQAFDACSPSYTQVLADKFLRSGVIYDYLAEIRVEYKKRAKEMIKQLEEYLPKEVKWVKPRGGFYIWLRLPEGVNSTEILKDAIEQGVVFVSGKTFDPEDNADNAIRVSYCNTDVDTIARGIPIVAKAIKEHLKNK